MQYVSKRDNVARVRQRSVICGTVLIETLCQLLQRLGCRPAADFIDCGKKLIEIDPIAIPQPYRFDAPFSMVIRPSELKCECDGRFGNRTSVVLRNDTPNFDRIRNETGLPDRRNLLACLVAGEPR